MRMAFQTRLWTLLNHPAFNSKKESDDHLAVFLRYFHKFHADHRPVFPLYDRIDDGHPFVLQDQNGRADELPNVEIVVVLRGYQPRSTATQFINDGIDIHAFHAEKQVNGLIGDH